jgi:hypothetical protein
MKGQPRLRTICHTCGKAVSLPFSLPRADEVVGVCPLCGGVMYCGTTMEGLLERHRDRQERMRYLRYGPGLSMGEKVGASCLLLVILTAVAALVWWF